MKEVKAEESKNFTMANDATGEEMDVDKVEGTDGRGEQVVGDEEEMEIDKEQHKGQKNEEEDKAEGDGEESGAEENLRTSTTSLVDRRLRERRTVERLVDACEPAKAFVIEQGHGVPLKEIPNVARKLSKKRPADLKLLHQTLFGGRQGKVSDFKNHILQFSGFAWHEEEESQRTKVKEKLSKCTKDMLLELFDLFDLPGSKAKRKEELVATVLEFLQEPRSAIDMTPSDKKTKNRKRKRGGASASKSSGGKPLKGSRKRNSPETLLEAQDEEEADGNGCEEDRVKHSEGEMEHTRSEDIDNNDGQLPKEEVNSKPSERIDASDVEKIDEGVTPTEMPIPTNEGALAITPSAKQPSTVEGNSTGGKVSRKKTVSGTRKKATPKTDRKEKSAGTRAAKGNAKPGKWATKPTRDELRQAVCIILDTANFATMTFGEVVKEVDKYFGKDLSARKPLIRSLIEEELFRLAEEAERKELEEEEAVEAKARAEEAAKERAKDERVEAGKDAKAEMAENGKDKSDELEAGEGGKAEEAVKNGNGDDDIEGTTDGKAEEAAENRNGDDDIEGSKDGKAEEARKNVNGNNYVEGAKDGKAEEADRNENGEYDVEGAKDGKAEQADRNENGEDDVQGAKDGKAKEVKENVNTEQSLIEAGHNGKAEEAEKSITSEVDIDAGKDGKLANTEENGKGEDHVKPGQDGKAAEAEDDGKVEDGGEASKDSNPVTTGNEVEA